MVFTKSPKMTKSPAAYQKAYRERKGQILKEKERIRDKNRRANQSDDQKSRAASKAKERMRKMRQRKKEENKEVTQLVIRMPAFRSMSQETRATKKVKQALPNSPSKKHKILQNVIADLGCDIVPPRKIKRERLSPELLTIVEEFYQREDIARWTPGLKEYVTVRDDTGQKTKMQKRYLLGNLRETYCLFKEETSIELSFSKFCDLRPKNILTFSKTPLEACCCLQHKNFINICNALAPHISGLDKYSREWVDKYCLCHAVSEPCLILTCVTCSGRYLEQFLDRVEIPTFEDDNDIEIKYPWWSTDDTGHVQRFDVLKPASEAFDSFKDLINKFIPHHLTKRHQAAEYVNAKKMCLETGSNATLLHFDFSENYSCAYQEGAQSAYWGQTQVSIFTAASYNETGTTMIALVSDKNDHTKSAISTYLDVLVKKHTKPGQHVKLWSDGPSTQFKNRFMASYMQDLRVKYQLASISWNFFASSHGKGAIDGVGGTLKRYVWNKVKSRALEVRNAEEFVAATQHLNVDVQLVPGEDIDQYYAIIEGDLANAPKIPGIQATHHWFSNLLVFSVEKLTKEQKLVEPNEEAEERAQTEEGVEGGIQTEEEAAEKVQTEEDVETMEENGKFQITDWVIVLYDTKYYPGIVVDVNGEDVKVRCMVQIGGTCYRWPQKEDCIFHNIKNVKKIDPPTSGGTGSRKYWVMADTDYSM